VAPLSLPHQVDVAAAVACNNSSRAVDLSVLRLWEIVRLPFAANVGREIGVH